MSDSIQCTMSECNDNLSIEQHNNGLLLKRHERPVTKVGFIKQWIISSSKNHDVVFSCAVSGKEQRRFVARHGAVNDWCVNNDASKLIAGLSDSTIQVWNVSNNECASVEFEGPVTAVKTNSSGDLIWAIIQVLGKSDVPAWLQKMEVTGISPTQTKRTSLPARCRAICLVGNERYLLLGTEQGVLYRHDATTLERIDACTLHKDTCNEIRSCRIESWVITSSSDRQAYVFDWAAMKPLYRFTSPVAINTAVLHPRHDEILLAGGQDARNVTTTRIDEAHFELQFFDLRTQVKTCELKTKHFGPIHSLAYNDDGSSLITGSEDGFIRLQTHMPDVETRRTTCIKKLKETINNAKSKNQRRRARKRLEKMLQ